MPSATVDGRFHPGRRERVGRCKDKCCTCDVPCGGSCQNEVGDGFCAGDCRWSCCGKTGRRSSWPGCCKVGETARAPAADVGGPVTDNNARAGLRVSRGVDWRWGEQDGGEGGLGRLVAKADTEGWWKVRWDSGRTNQYRVGADGCFDLTVAADDTPPTDTSPSTCGGPVTPSNARPGLRVVRGVDWQWGDQDGGEGRLGQLVRPEGEGWWHVKWDAGSQNAYRVGKGGCFDLSVASADLPGETSGRRLQVGDKVKLVSGYDCMSDAAGGPLRPGLVGELIEDDRSGKPFKVRCGGREWWYVESALQSASAEDAPSRSRLSVGASVQLAQNFQLAGDAADGPLSPGDIGRIVQDDHSNMPYQVKFKGREWWYMEGALVAAGSPDRAEPVSSSRMKVGDLVRLAAGFEQHSDAAKGPLALGDVGKVIDESVHRCRVRFKGKEWWYDHAALEVTKPSDTDSDLVIVTEAIAKPGLRVIRGKDWMWGDQDGSAGRAGTLLREAETRWWTVDWDEGGSNNYRVGVDGCYDLYLAPGVSSTGASTARPAAGTNVTSSLARPGLRVVRGPHWSWKEQDGGAGMEGTVVPPFVELPGWCSVQWDAGGSFNYRCGEGGHFDLAVAPTGKFEVGQLVCLSDSYRQRSDAALGPLEPGDKGVVVAVGSRVQVEAGGRKWWYDAKALRRWLAAAPPAPAPTAAETNSPPDTPAARVNLTERPLLLGRTGSNSERRASNADAVDATAAGAASAQRRGDATGSPKATLPLGERTFAKSIYKELYDSQAAPPEYQHQVMAAIQGLIARHCEEREIPPRAGKILFEQLQAEILRRAEGLEEMLGQVCCAAQRLWTSGLALPTENPKDRVELSHIINEAIRTDRPAALEHVVVLSRAINSLCTVRSGARDAMGGHFPPGGRLWRGGGLPDEHRAFYEEGKKYRVPGFLASSDRKEVTDSFVYRAWDAGVPPVLWRIELDPRGETEFKYRCKHVNYVTNSHFDGGQSESEYLFSPYSAFTVKKVNWKERPDDDDPHEVVLVAAIDNRKEPEDLPLAPWF